MTGQPPRRTPARLRAGYAIAGLVLVVTATGLSAPATASAIASKPRPGTPEKPAGRAFTCAAPAPSPAFRVVAKLPTVEGLTKRQVVDLAALATRGHQQDLPARAQAIALMTALAARGGSTSPERLGTRAPSLDPREFYRELEDTADWQKLPPSVVGHRIFKTPDPYVFEDYWAPSVTLLADLSGRPFDKVKVAVSPGAEAPSGCSPDSQTREFPLPAGTGYRVINANRPARSATATTPTTPTLLAAPCGTAVLSATPGAVHIKSGVRGAGPWLLEVRNEATGEKTSYAHVGKPLVNEGEIVPVGRPLATVGDFGSVAGCALGFGVESQKEGELSRPQATSWLRATQLPPIAAEPVNVAPPEPGPTTFRFATFNVLGAHLTGRGNDRPQFGPGPTRMAAALGKLDALGASISVFNEFERPAESVVLANPNWTVQRATPNNVFRDGNYSGNAIAWREDVWELVDATEFTVPWQVTLHMPVVTLRNLETGGKVVVVGVHNPASTARQGNQSGARNVARAVEREQIAAIKEQTGLPVLFAGDMNERSEALCDFTRDGLLNTWTRGAANCAAYGYGGVDFIFGGGDLVFVDQVVDRSTLGGISDHPMVTSSVTLNP